MIELLGGSQKPRSADFSLTVRSGVLTFAQLHRSYSLHAQITRAFEDMRLLEIHSVHRALAQIAAAVKRLSPLDRFADEILLLVLEQLDNRTKFFAAKASRRWRAVLCQ